MSRIAAFGVIVVLALPACQTINRPSTDPAKMSSDTLCYRSAGAKKSDAIEDEIAARRLDCRSILENDPLIHHGARY